MPASVPTPAPAPAPADIPLLAQPPVDITGDGTHTIGVNYWGDNSAANGGKGETIDDVPCLVITETFHIHAHLSIAFNGQLLAIPQHLGMVPTSPTFGGCFYQIHTHDLSGRVHIESAAPVTYRLGSFFKIWGQPLSRTNVAGITGMPVVFYITDNGTTQVYEGDPAAIALTSHRQITIQIGTPLTEIPNFTWAGM